QGGPHDGEWTEWKKGCKCEDLELANKAVENEKRKKYQRKKDIFSRNSLISKDLEKATFENYIPKTKEQAYAKKTENRFVDIYDIDNPMNLLINGSFEIGKSHIDKAIADGVMEKGYTAIFISVPKLLRKIKSTFNKDSDINADDIIQRLEN